MKEFFIYKRFGAEATRMIEIINAILADYARQGYDLSLRQLYYQLVSKNHIENKISEYKKLGDLVSDARYAGKVDWSMIQDRGRSTTSNPHWEDPVHFMTSVAPQYRFDLWKNQSSYVEVMVEKQALEGVLEPVCQRLDIPFSANKGYSSSSAFYGASKRYLRKAKEGKSLYIIYLGDHDPSGIDMSRDVEDRLNLFLGTSYFNQEGHEANRIEVKRVALNIDQVRELNPPENPAKTTDSRAADYIARFGTSSWELDAVEPRQLDKLVTDAVNSICDLPKMKAMIKQQEEERKKLVEFAKTYKP